MADPRATVEDLVVGDLTLRRIEELLSGRNTLAPEAESQLRTGGAPPAVSGLTLVSAAGTIVVRWNPSPARDVSLYEVQLSTAAHFPSPVTRPSASTTFEWSEGTPGVTYFVRVRAVSQAGTPGPFDLVVDTETGLVTTAGMTLNAATGVGTFVQASGFTLMDLNSNGIGTPVTATETYGPVVVAAPDANSVVYPMLYLEYEFATANQNFQAADVSMIEFLLLRRPSGGSDTEVSRATIDTFSNVGIIGIHRNRAVAPTFSPFDLPGAGTWEYRVRIIGTTQNANADANGPYIQFLTRLVRCQAIVLKR